jgi:hypothetical protein
MYALGDGAPKPDRLLGGEYRPVGAGSAVSRSLSDLGSPAAADPHRQLAAILTLT